MSTDIWVSLLVLTIMTFFMASVLTVNLTITPLRYLPLVRSVLPAAYPPDPPLAECRPSSLPLAAFSFSYRPVSVLTVNLTLKSMTFTLPRPGECDSCDTSL